VAGRPVRLLDPDGLVGACTVPGVPGLVPHPEQSLALVPGWMLGQFEVAQRGVIALGVDGPGWAAAAATWRSAELACLTSTFPTISATAWLTAMTGVGPGTPSVWGTPPAAPAHRRLTIKGDFRRLTRSRQNRATSLFFSY
jgi:hypothetical protein